MNAADLREEFKKAATPDPHNRVTPLERVLPMLEALVKFAEDIEASVGQLHARNARKKKSGMPRHRS